MKRSATRVFGTPRTPAWALAALLSVVVQCRADVVRTADGRRLVGTVSVEGHALRVDGRQVELGDLLDVAFDRRVRAGATSCVLVDGTTLAGRIDGIDDKQVRVTTAAAGAMPVPIDRVARVCFTNVGGEQLGRVPADGHGLLLRDGDFFDGTVTGFNGGTVTMSSPLLGESTFSTTDRAAAVVLRSSSRRGGNWEVRTSDGSTWVAGTVVLTGGVVRAEVAGLGSVALRWSDVVLIRAGGDRVMSLADMTPTGGTALVDATPVGLPPRLIVGAVERSVCVAAGTSVTYRLDRQFTAFACQAGVVAGVVPTAGVRWAARLDGRLVAECGAPRTSVDDPVEIDLPTAGIRELTLSVEPTAGGAGGPVLFADPALVRTGRSTTGPGEKFDR